MGRFMRGAPAQYAAGGQSQSARAQHAPTGSTQQDKLLRLLRTDPKRVQKMVPRLTWPQVIERAGFLGTVHAVRVADTMPVEFEVLQGLPSEIVHQAAFALYDCGAPVESVRAAVELAWIAHSTLFMTLAGDQAFHILRHCQFKVPAELGPVFPVWRGVRGVSIEAARAGYSWTTNPLVAATWAEHIGARDVGRISGEPLVLRREVKATDVIYYSDNHGMAEVVVDASPGGEVDGDRDEWREAAIKYAAQLAVDGAVARGFGW